MFGVFFGILGRLQLRTSPWHEISAGVEETVNLIHRELMAEGHAARATKLTQHRHAVHGSTGRRSEKGAKGSVSEAVSKEGFRNLLPNRRGLIL
jgi:hypothetical protein